MNDLGFGNCTTRELEALCATVGVDEDISQEMFEEIQANAERIWGKAVDEFDKYLESKNLECCMGLIIQKNKKEKKKMRRFRVYVSGYTLVCAENEIEASKKPWKRQDMNQRKWRSYTKATTNTKIVAKFTV